MLLTFFCLNLFLHLHCYEILQNKTCVCVCIYFFILNFKSIIKKKTERITSPTQVLLIYGLIWLISTYG